MTSPGTAGDDVTAPPTATPTATATAAHVTPPRPTSSREKAREQEDGSFAMIAQLLLDSDVAGGRIK